VPEKIKILLTTVDYWAYITLNLLTYSPHGKGKS